MTSFRQAVLDWSDGGRRDLPWRRTRDPWAILVSEVMLQQTQVARVVAHWQAFLSRFPDVASCAAAGAGDVIALWAGLGYNRRAVQLHRAAVAVVDRHGGEVPASLAGLQALPGIGPYTARAVMAFAFEQPAAIVDTNVARVLARAVAGRRLSAAEAQATADSLVPAGQAWRWNQALLDLGARHCTGRTPSCHDCPLAASGCAWAGAGFPDPDPAGGSGGVSARQSRFDGSDRQGRGRLVKAIQRGPVDAHDWATAAGWPLEPARAARAAASLVRDGLAVHVGDQLRLP